MKLVLPLLMYKETGSIKKGTKKSKYVVPSWNHLYIIRNNRPILDKWALDHKDILIAKLSAWKSQNNWTTTQNQKVAVNIWVYWNDKRRKDCHNLDKLVLDAMNEIIFDDDCNALVRFMDFEYDKENPRIEVNFEILGEVKF